MGKKILDGVIESFKVVVPTNKEVAAYLPTYERTIMPVLPKEAKKLKGVLPGYDTTLKPVLPDEKILDALFPKNKKAKPGSGIKFPEPKASGRRDDHPYLKSVKDEHSFKLKTDHGSVFAEVLMLEGLSAEIKKAPDEAIVFHMKGRNDFASWVKDCVGDWWLGSRMEKIELSDPAVTKFRLVKTLDERINKLKTA